MKCNLLIIDDASRDNSLEEIMEFAKTASEKKFHITIYKNLTPKFETYCDNFLFSKAKSKYIIEIQSDMEIFEKDFDKKLIEAINSKDFFIAISGRGTHDFESLYDNFIKSLGTDRAYEKNIYFYILSRIKYHVYNFYKKNHLLRDFSNKELQENTFEEMYTPNLIEFRETGQVGRLGKLVELLPSDESLRDKKIWSGETIMRGPIIFDRSKFNLVGGLATDTFFQGFDDHEFFLKANFEHEFRVGYTPIGFKSPIFQGSGRKPPTIKNDFIIVIMIIKRSRKLKSSYLKNYPKIKNKIIRKREIFEY